MRVFYQIRAKVVKPLIDVIKQNGDDIEVIFKQLLIPLKAQSDDETFISWLCVRKLTTYINNKYDTPVIGFDSINKIGTYHLQPYTTYIHHNSTSLINALELFSELNNRYESYTNYWLEHENENLYFCYKAKDNLHLANHIIEQMIVATMIEVIRYFCSKDWSPNLIYVKDIEKSAFEHSYMKNSQLFFQQPYCKLSIDAEVQELFKPIKVSSLSPMNTDIINEVFSKRLERLLTPYLDEFMPTLEQTSKITGLSARTIQRNLEKEQLTFRQFIEHIRFNLAKYWLTSTDITIIELSERLHYNSYNNFTRAFRRWTGLSPTEYRLKNSN